MPLSKVFSLLLLSLLVLIMISVIIWLGNNTIICPIATEFAKVDSKFWKSGKISPNMNTLRLMFSLLPLPAPAPVVVADDVTVASKFNLCLLQTTLLMMSTFLACQGPLALLPKYKSGWLESLIKKLPNKHKILAQKLTGQFPLEIWKTCYHFSKVAEMLPKKLQPQALKNRTKWQ